VAAAVRHVAMGVVLDPPRVAAQVEGLGNPAPALGDVLGRLETIGGDLVGSALLSQDHGRGSSVRDTESGGGQQSGGGRHGQSGLHAAGGGRSIE
jgi:hypothetical protein